MPTTLPYCTHSRATCASSSSSLRRAKATTSSKYIWDPCVGEGGSTSCNLKQKWHDCASETSIVRSSIAHSSELIDPALNPDSILSEPLEGCHKPHNVILTTQDTKYNQETASDCTNQGGSKLQVTFDINFQEILLSSWPTARRKFSKSISSPSTPHHHFTARPSSGSRSNTKLGARLDLCPRTS